MRSIGATGTALSAEQARALQDDGFVRMRGPIPADAWKRFTAAYDTAIATAAGPALRHGSTTTRLHDLMDLSSVFDRVFMHPPLLVASRQVIGEPLQLSAMLGRTVRPHVGAQALHVDLPRGSQDAPMAGFILMVDEFVEDNGATAFVPGSHRWADAPPSGGGNGPEAVTVCGPAGSMIVFDAAIWHGHTANRTDRPRRSVQGYFVRRGVASATEYGARMRPETVARLSTAGRELLGL